MKDYAECMTELMAATKAFHKATLRGEWEEACVCVVGLVAITRDLAAATKKEYDKRRKEAL